MTGLKAKTIYLMLCRAVYMGMTDLMDAQNEKMFSVTIYPESFIIT